MTLIDYQIRLVQFPSGKVHESVTENEDGTYTIFIDSSLNSIEQRKQFVHAIRHIMEKDFEKTDVDKIEKCAHYVFEVSDELCPTF